MGGCRRGGQTTWIGLDSPWKNEDKIFKYYKNINFFYKKWIYASGDR